jgi:hypothetical protein
MPFPLIVVLYICFSFSFGMRSPSLKKLMMSSKFLSYFWGHLRLGENIFLGLAMEKD